MLCDTMTVIAVLVVIVNFTKHIIVSKCHLVKDAVAM